MTGTASQPYELYVLLVWHPPLGMAAYPVGVLAMSEGARYVAWLPMAYEKAIPWRRRLAGPTTPDQVRAWAEESGAVQLAPAELPAADLPMDEAAEVVLKQLIAEVIPLLHLLGGP